jgi:hypothetical protein
MQALDFIYITKNISTLDFSSSASLLIKGLFDLFCTEAGSLVYQKSHLLFHRVVIGQSSAVYNHRNWFQLIAN